MPGTGVVQSPLFIGDSGARWSIYGAERAQTAAMGRKCAGRENGSDRPNPSPSGAVSCVHKEMVKRLFATGCRILSGT
jgi:hypothetical protein